MINPGDVHILVIDDDALTAKAVAANFEVFGFQVNKVEKVEQAQKALKQKEYQIVVMDWHMPQGGGELLLKEIRDAHWEKPAVFLVTGDHEVEESHVFAMGADGFLHKPFEASTIRNLIQHSCRSRKERWLTPFRLETNFEIVHETLSLDGEKRSLALGRGGFFVKAPEKYPQAEDVIEFVLHVEDDRECRKISGKGLVRWIRSQQKEEMSPGFGVEIKFLDDIGRDLFIEWVEKHEPQEFIPLTV